MLNWKEIHLELVPYEVDQGIVNDLASTSWEKDGTTYDRDTGKKTIRLLGQEQKKEENIYIIEGFCQKNQHPRNCHINLQAP